VISFHSYSCNPSYGAAQEGGNGNRTIMRSYEYNGHTNTDKNNQLH